MRALRGCGPQTQGGYGSGSVWEVTPKKVKVLYTKPEDLQWYPEYVGTRETLTEAGGTTPQA